VLARSFLGKLPGILRGLEGEYGERLRLLRRRGDLSAREAEALEVLGELCNCLGEAAGVLERAAGLAERLRRLEGL